MCAALACAQTTQGVISGRMVDAQSGEPVRGAVIRIVQLSSDAVIYAAGGADGGFVLPLLSPGSYRIRVEAGDDYQAQELYNLEVPVSENLELRFRLRPRKDVWQQHQRHSVFLPDKSVLVFFGPDVDTSRTGSFEANGGRKFALESSLSNVIDPAQVRDLPLAGRDVYTMLITQPGVAASTAIGRGLGVSAAGQRPSSANFMLDGLQNNNFLTTGPLSAAAPEAIQEYRISTANFTAEYGGASGLLANAVTRSGTTEWHGLAYLYTKRHALNANDFQRNVAGAPRLPMHELQPGFRAGGPVWRRILFASLAFEWLRFRSELPLRPYTLPTAQFLPDADTTAARLLKQYPAPAFQNAGGPMAAVRLGPRTSLDRYLALPRIDAVLGARHRLFARVALNRLERPNLAWSPFTAFNVPLRQNTHGLAIGWTATVSPGVANEARIGRGSQLLSIERPNPAVPYLVTLDGVTLPGSRFSYDFRNEDRNWQLIENLAWTRRAHAFKFGGELLARVADGSLAFGGNGLYRFLDLAAFGKDQVRSVAFTVSRPEAPIAGGTTQNIPPFPDPRRSYAYRQFAVFAQDVWRPFPRLSLNYGVRYENFGAPRAAGDFRELLVEPGPGRSAFEQLQGAHLARQSRPQLYRADNNNWSPRLGFSYALRERRRTLLRGAYGIFYDRPFDNYWQPLRVNSMLGAESASVSERVAYLSPLAALARDHFRDVTLNPQTPRLTIYDSTIRDAYIHSYFLGVQQEMAANFVIQVSGLGSRGRNLTTTDLVNRAMTLPRPEPGNPFRVVNRDLPPDLFYRASAGRSRYEALMVEARYRAGRGQVHVAYTASRSFDNQSDPLAGDFFNLGFSRTGLPTAILPLPAFTVQFNPASDWGHSDFDQRHNLAVYSLWELPKSRLGSGWRVSGMAAVRSGLPFSVIARSRDGALINPRADLTVANASAFQHVPYGGGVSLLRAAAFAPPASGTSGTTSRNGFSGPGFWSLDLSLSREFRLRPLGEAGRIQLRVDAFNALNHANLNNPENFLQSNPAFGFVPFGVALYGRRDRGTGFPTLVPFDESARQIQLMLRVQW